VLVDDERRQPIGLTVHEPARRAVDRKRGAVVDRLPEAALEQGTFVNFIFSGNCRTRRTRLRQGYGGQAR
jgi:hypothetical protein